jgi:hypothetical protein
MKGNEIWLYPWSEQINTSIQNAINSCIPRFWKENDITTSILRAICAMHQPVLLQSQKPNHLFSVEWDSFKRDGELEKECGDVAILVRLHSYDMPTLEGVGYFEAKRIYKNGCFSGVKSWEQLELMRHNIPHHHVVLYDFAPCSWNKLRATHFGWELAYSDEVKCLTLPTNRMLALKLKTRKLYNHSMPFSEQLCLRYLQGFDLEFDKYLVEAAKGFGNHRGIPSFLLVANVVIGDGERPLEHKFFSKTKLSSSFISLTNELGHNHNNERMF